MTESNFNLLEKKVQVQCAPTNPTNDSQGCVKLINLSNYAVPPKTLYSQDYFA